MSCCVSQRYWKMKAIHNPSCRNWKPRKVVVYPKDTEKWKQFTTGLLLRHYSWKLLCIPKILKNESNSQHFSRFSIDLLCCCVSQRYWKMKAIHNTDDVERIYRIVVVYPKDTEKWKQFTTSNWNIIIEFALLCIPKILKNESNSQLCWDILLHRQSCCVSQRYWKMKAIHNFFRLCLF